MLVEDNEGLLFNTKLLLEMKNYNVKTAINGKKALEMLEALENHPDIIISDIMMPEMDGYTLYKNVSENIEWSSIPFIFLTAKSSAEDILLGKKLGVDDYIIKPFNHDELLASIEGKINKIKKNEILREKYEKELSKISVKNNEKDSSNLDNNNLVLFLVDWDDVRGPTFVKSYPEEKIQFSLENLGFRLYNVCDAIYGSKGFDSAIGTLIRVNHLNMDAFLYYDVEMDENARGGFRLFMIVAMAPQIRYLESERIQEKVTKIAELYKEDKNLDFQPYWSAIQKILS